MELWRVWYSILTQIIMVRKINDHPAEFWAEIFEIAEVTQRRACFGATARALDEDETRMPVDEAWWKGV
jgi:hypothetical protein